MSDGVASPLLSSPVAAGKKATAAASLSACIESSKKDTDGKNSSSSSRIHCASSPAAVFGALAAEWAVAVLALLDLAEAKAAFVFEHLYRPFPCSGKAFPPPLYEVLSMTKMIKYLPTVVAASPSSSSSSKFSKQNSNTNSFREKKQSSSSSSFGGGSGGLITVGQHGGILISQDKLQGARYRLTTTTSSATTAAEEGAARHRHTCDDNNTNHHNHFIDSKKKNKRKEEEEEKEGGVRIPADVTFLSIGQDEPELQQLHVCSGAFYTLINNVLGTGTAHSNNSYNSSSHYPCGGGGNDKTNHYAEHNIMFTSGTTLVRHASSSTASTVAGSAPTTTPPNGSSSSSSHHLLKDRCISFILSEIGAPQQVHFCITQHTQQQQQQQQQKGGSGSGSVTFILYGILVVSKGFEGREIGREGSSSSATDSASASASCTFHGIALQVPTRDVYAQLFTTTMRRNGGCESRKSSRIMASIIAAYRGVALPLSVLLGVGGGGGVSGGGYVSSLRRAADGSVVFEQGMRRGGALIGPGRREVVTTIHRPQNLLTTVSSKTNTHAWHTGPANNDSDDDEETTTFTSSDQQQQQEAQSSSLGTPTYAEEKEEVDDDDLSRVSQAAVAVATTTTTTTILSKIEEGIFFPTGELTSTVRRVISTNNNNNDNNTSTLIKGNRSLGLAAAISNDKHNSTATTKSKKDKKKIMKKTGNTGNTEKGEKEKSEEEKEVERKKVPSSSSLIENTCTPKRLSIAAQHRSLRGTGARAHTDNLVNALRFFYEYVLRTLYLPLYGDVDAGLVQQLGVCDPVSGRLIFGKRRNAATGVIVVGDFGGDRPVPVLHGFGASYRLGFTGGGADVGGEPTFFEQLKIGEWRNGFLHGFGMDHVGRRSDSFSETALGVHWAAAGAEEGEEVAARPMLISASLFALSTFFNFRGYLCSGTEASPLQQTSLTASSTTTCSLSSASTTTSTTASAHLSAAAAAAAEAIAATTTTNPAANAPPVEVVLGTTSSSHPKIDDKKKNDEGHDIVVVAAHDDSVDSDNHQQQQQQQRRQRLLASLYHNKHFGIATICQLEQNIPLASHHMVYAHYIGGWRGPTPGQQQQQSQPQTTKEQEHGDDPTPLSENRGGIPCRWGQPSGLGRLLYELQTRNQAPGTTVKSKKKTTNDDDANHTSNHQAIEKGSIYTEGLFDGWGDGDDEDDDGIMRRGSTTTRSPNGRSSSSSSIVRCRLPSPLLPVSGGGGGGGGGLCVPVLRTVRYPTQYNANGTSSLGAVLVTRDEATTTTTACSTKAAAPSAAAQNNLQPKSKSKSKQSPLRPSSFSPFSCRWHIVNAFSGSCWHGAWPQTIFSRIACHDGGALVQGQIVRWSVPGTREAYAGHATGTVQGPQGSFTVRRHGHGAFTNFLGLRYRGIWRADRVHGKGVAGLLPPSLLSEQQRSHTVIEDVAEAAAHPAQSTTSLILSGSVTAAVVPVIFSGQWLAGMPGGRGHGTLVAGGVRRRTYAGVWRGGRRQLPSGTVITLPWCGSRVVVVRAAATARRHAALTTSSAAAKRHQRVAGGGSGRAAAINRLRGAALVLHPEMAVLLGVARRAPLAHSGIDPATGTVEAVLSPAVMEGERAAFLTLCAARGLDAATDPDLCRERNRRAKRRERSRTHQRGVLRRFLLELALEV